MDKSDVSTWSMGSEGSIDDQIGKLFSIDLKNLCLNSSLDSDKSGENEIVSRGPINRKKTANQRQCPVNGTSKYVLNLMENSGSKSSESSSSISPTQEIPISSLPCEQSSTSNSLSPEFDSNQQLYIMSNSQGQSTRKILQKIIINRLFRKKSKVDRYQWKFDFGDTTLIKCCRGNQVREVREAIKELFDYHQYGLLDHKNAGNETALSIATFQMNEVLINVLLESGASCLTELSMKNNVLHVAADLNIDRERKTLSCLIRAIQRYQPEHFVQCITAKNIFNCDPIGILYLHRNAHMDNHFAYNKFQGLIDEIRSFIISCHQHSSLI